MPSKAFNLSKTRLQSNRLTRTLRGKFSAQPDVRSAAVLGNKLIAVGGTLYDSTVDGSEAGTAISVVNVGRPAAAVYAPSSGGTAVVTVSSGGGGGGTASSFSQLSGTISDAQAPQFLKSDGSRALYGNLLVTEGTTIDGVDLSVHAANPNAHHNWQHSMLSTADHTYSGGSALDVFGLSSTSTLGLLTPSDNPGASAKLLRSSSAGNLTLESLTTPLLTATSNLLVNPVGDVLFPNNQTIRTETFSSSFPIGGFELYETAISGQSGLTIGVIEADELRVRVFVANETRVDRGEKYDGKSFGITSEPFTSPSSIGGTVKIYFEDSPALSGAIFSNNDWLLFRTIDIDTGLATVNIWGQVSGYTDEAGAFQSWTFTLRQGNTNYPVKKSAFSTDWGASGQGLIHYSAVDPTGAPYIEFLTWAGANPYTPANWTTHVRIGKLVSSLDNDLSPTGYGLFGDNVFLKGDLLTGGGYIRIYQASGINLEDQPALGGINTVRALQWWPDITDFSGDPSLSIYSQKSADYPTDGQNYGFITLKPTGNYLASMYLTAEGQGSGNDASIAIFGGSSAASTAAQIQMSAAAFQLNGTLSTKVITTDGLLPSNANAPNDIGANANRFDTIYANNIVAGTLTADVSVGSTLSGAIWQNDDSNMTIESNSSSNRVLYVTNPGSGTMTLNVDNDIVVGGNVDGVDISAFKSNYDSHTHAHSALTGLTSGDNHTQYVHLSTARTITAQHSFSPGSAQAPFVLGANAQGQTVTGLKADQLNKQVIAGSGLSGTGTLTSDVTLAIGWGTPTISTITPDASANAGTATTPARSDHTHAIVAAAPSTNLSVSTTNAEGSSTSFLRSDATFAITSSNNPGAAASLLASSSAGGLTLQSLNIGSVGSISTSGVVTMADDTDTLHKFGRAYVGYASYADLAAFGHRDWASAGNYALMQGGADANTYLNAVTGNSIYHRVANADVLQMTAQRLNPAGSSQIDLGDYNRKYRTLFASELYVEVLVAQSVMATIGGRIMVAPTTKLIADVNTYQSYIDVKDNNLFNADFVRLETAPGGVPQVESMRVVSVPTAIAGGWRVNVLRKVDSTPVATLIAAISSTGATTMDVSTNVLTTGNYVYLQVTGSPLIETIQINSTPTTISGGFRYTIIRNVTGTGASTWALGANVNYTYRSWVSGDAVVSLGGGSPDVAALIATMTSGAATMDTNGGGFVNGGYYYLQTATQYEMILVTSAPTVITGGYRYTVTRNINLGGAKTWASGNKIMDQARRTGTGYIDLTSTSTIHNKLGPTITIYNRTWFDNWNDTKPVVSMGNLRSFVDYTSDTFGWGVGNDLTLSPTSGFSGMTGDANSGLRQFNTYTKMYQSGTEVLRIDPTVGIDMVLGTNHYNKISWKTSIADVTPIAAISTYNPGSGYKYMDIQADEGAYHGLIRIAADTTNGAFVTLEGRSASSTFGLTVTPTLATIGNIYFENNYSGGDSATASVISNDTGTYKALTLFGNTSAGSGTRVVKVYDNMVVAGDFRAGTSIATSTSIKWTLGDYTAAPQTSTGYITVVINGTAYKLLAHT